MNTKKSLIFLVLAIIILSAIPTFAKTQTETKSEKLKYEEMKYIQTSLDFIKYNLKFGYDDNLVNQINYELINAFEIRDRVFFVYEISDINDLNYKKKIAVGIDLNTNKVTNFVSYK